jgi:hypothetical protein
LTGWEDSGTIRIIVRPLANLECAHRSLASPTPNARSGTTMNALRTGAIAIALLSFGISACSSDNPSDPGGSSGAPNVGTTYDFRGVTYDNVGRTVNASDIISVIAGTDQSYFGKTGLVKMITAGNAGYLDYRNDGDLGMVYYITVNGARVDSSWLAYPFGTKGSGAIPPVDRDLLGMPVSMRGEIAYAGTESVTVPGGTFETQKVRVASRLKMGDGAGMLRNERIDTLWYAPAIHYIVKQSGIQYHVFDDEDTTTYYNVVTLTSHSLK